MLQDGYFPHGLELDDSAHCRRSYWLRDEQDRHQDALPPSPGKASIWMAPSSDPGCHPPQPRGVAANIGAVVGRELLSEDAIRNYLDDPEFRSALEHLMRVNFIPNRRLRERLYRLVVDKMVKFRNEIEVDKRIEDRVKQYDVDAMEGMILGVTQQHLRWISWFGAVLGALIGCLQLLLNVLS